MRYLSAVEKLFNFNKGRTLFVFAFDSMYLEDGIKLALKETFPHDLFVTFFASGIKASFVREFLEAEAKRNHTDIDESLFNTLADKAEYSEKELRLHFEGWLRQKLIVSEYPQYAEMRPSDKILLPSKTSPHEQLSNLIGLAETKRQIEQVIANIRLQERRHAKSIDSRPPCLHMMFMGNPGTGKTTVARLIGEIFVIEGIIPRGKFYEVSSVEPKSDVSWSDTFEQARGSVLFIDEAYSLDDNTINKLVPFLENYREDTVVIFAGYKEEMQKFLYKNIGLASRIPHHIDFPNYSPAELAEIIDSVLIEKGYSVSAYARKVLHSELRQLHSLEGNARDIRTIVEKAISEAARRLSQLDLNALSHKELQTLKIMDFAPILRRLRKERRRKVTKSLLGSKYFSIPLTHAVKFSGRVFSAWLKGYRLSKSDVLAMVSEEAISISTDLIMHTINRSSSSNNR